MPLRETQEPEMALARHRDIALVLAAMWPAW
jgi:hypothetical protein